MTERKGRDILFVVRRKPDGKMGRIVRGRAAQGCTGLRKAR